MRRAQLHIAFAQCCFRPLKGNANLLEDFAKLASGAFGAVMGARDEAQAQFRQRIERLAGRLDLVTREEFEAAREMAANARAAQEVLEERLAVLERRLAAFSEAAGMAARQERETPAESAEPALPKPGPRRTPGGRGPGTTGGGRPGRGGRRPGPTG